MSRLGGGMVVIVADHGWRNPVYLPVSAPSASWQVSTVSRFSAQLSARLAMSIASGDLKGKLLRYDDPLMGPWGGEIKRNPTQTRAGTMELSADSLHGRMRGILTPISSKTMSGSPGQLAMRLITRSPSRKRLGFDSMVASSGGPVSRLDLRADDLYDVIEKLAADNDHEFNCTLNDDGTVDWVFQHRVGSDLTGSVILADNWNVTDIQLSPTIDEITNEIIAVSDEAAWPSAQKRRVIDSDSQAAYEPQAETRQYPGSSGPASLVARAKQDLMVDAVPAIPATVLVPGNHPVLRLIREGDTVRLWSGNQIDRYFFRIISRSIERGGGSPVAKLSGNCTVEVAP